MELQCNKTDSEKECATNGFLTGTDFTIGFCLLSYSVKCMRQSIALSQSLLDQSDELSTVSSTAGCDSIADAYLKLAEYCQIGYSNETLQGVCQHNAFF